MRKKILIVICSFAVLIVGIIPLSIVIKQGIDEKKLYSSYYTLDDDFIIEAANGSLSQKKNTIEFIKTAYNSGANCVELDLTFDPSGVAYIEEHSYNINADTLKLEQVLKMLSKDALYSKVKLDLKINSVDNLPIVDELCKKYNVADRVFFTGVNLNQAIYVKNMSKIPFYLTVELKESTDNEYLSNVFDDIINSSAIGVICDVDSMSHQFDNMLYENWIKISFENLKSKKEYIKALAFSPNRIKTDKPYEVLELIHNWQDNSPTEFYGLEITEN